MRARITEHRIDPSCPMRDSQGHLVGMGDHVRHVCGVDLGTVIGAVTIGGTQYVRSERDYAGTYATPGDELIGDAR